MDYENHFRKRLKGSRVPETHGCCTSGAAITLIDEPLDVIALLGPTAAKVSLDNFDVRIPD
ncbi:hypothetical protein PRK78_002682 [Emydomyces testavorans]|uniref:Uncharacterized protein n=1 Tax=Emydomyces testavorans TaxID=2070801 RepID=A0AAF0IGR4_9EURO|nr:hypothetical protein PRK78_002682 [Emydomyces testavorans]